MGIRFACHECDFQLHVKDFQAGRRGKCPKCQVRFRIPTADAPKSFPISDSDSDSSNREANSVSSTPAGKTKTYSATQPTETLPAQSVDVGPATVSQTPQAAVGTKLTESQTAQTHPPAAPAPSPQVNLASVLMQSSVWYLRDASGNQLGPAGADQMQVWIGEGKAKSDSFVWCDAWPDWKAASEVFPGHCGTAPLPPPPPSAAASPSVPAPPPAATATEVASVPLTTNTTNSSSTLAGTGVSAAQQAQIDRRMKKKRRYQFMMITLSIVAVLLLVVLGLVLAFQE